MGNTASNETQPSGERRRRRGGAGNKDVLTRSVMGESGTLSQAIPIDFNRSLSVTLTEVQSSSLTSTCVDVSHPFENVSGDESDDSSPAGMELKISDVDKDGEVDLAGLNMMQILCAESPQLRQSLSSAGGLASEATHPQHKDKDDLAHLAAENADSCNSGTPCHSWRERSSPQDGTGEEKSIPESQHTPYEVYTMSFGGVQSYSCGSHSPAVTPSCHDSSKDDHSELELDAALPQGQTEEKPSRLTTTGQLEDHSAGRCYEIYDVTFGGVHTFCTSNTSHAKEESKRLSSTAENRLKRQDEETREKLSSSQQDGEKSEAGSCLPIAGKDSNGGLILIPAPESNKRIASEVYTMTFEGLYTFSAAKSPRGGDCNGEAMDAQPKLEQSRISNENGSGREREPMTSEESNNVDTRDDAKPPSQQESTNVPYELLAMSFGGVHVFTSSPSTQLQKIKPVDEPIPTSSENSSQNREDSRSTDMTLPENNDGTHAEQSTTIPYEVHTVTYRGCHIFSVACSDIAKAETMVM